MYALLYETTNPYYEAFGWVVARNNMKTEQPRPDTDFIFDSLKAVETVRESLMRAHLRTTNYTIFKI